jgi:hypothetical protein
VVFTENLECFTSNLPVQKEIFVVEDKEDGARRGAKVAQVAALDAQ